MPRSAKHRPRRPREARYEIRRQRLLPRMRALSRGPADGRVARNRPAPRRDRLHHLLARRAPFLVQRLSRRLSQPDPRRTASRQRDQEPADGAERVHPSRSPSHSARRGPRDRRPLDQGPARRRHRPRHQQFRVDPVQPRRRSPRPGDQLPIVRGNPRHPSRLLDPGGVSPRGRVLHVSGAGLGREGRADLPQGSPTTTTPKAGSSPSASRRSPIRSPTRRSGRPPIRRRRTNSRRGAGTPSSVGRARSRAPARRGGATGTSPRR